MNTKWALFNSTTLCRAPADEMGAGVAETTDFNTDDGDAIAAALYADEPEVAPIAAADPADPEGGDDPETGEGDDPDAELTDEEKAAALEAQEAADEEAVEAAKIKAAKDAGEEVEQVYTVKVDGKEFEVTETELLAGFQRQQDYTQKTQTLAEQRREFEQKRTAELTELKNALAYYALPTAKEPNPEDFANKPDQFMEAYGQWRHKAAHQAEASQILEAITADEKARTKQREAGLLEKAIPEWADKTTRTTEFASMVECGSERYGFTPEEIAQVTDHRLLLLLRDAAKGAALEAKPVVLKRKTEIKPKLSAGTKTKTNPKAEAHAKALAKLNKGNAGDDDLENLFFQ